MEQSEVDTVFIKQFMKEIGDIEAINRRTDEFIELQRAVTYGRENEGQ